MPRVCLVLPKPGSSGGQQKPPKKKEIRERRQQKCPYLGSWGRLLESVDAHVKGHQHKLAARASTACQPQKAPALVPDLLVAGLNEAHVTGSGAWSCTLELPALLAPRRNHPYRRTVEARARKEAHRLRGPTGTTSCTTQSRERCSCRGGGTWGTSRRCSARSDGRRRGDEGGDAAEARRVARHESLAGASVAGVCTRGGGGRPPCERTHIYIYTYTYIHIHAHTYIQSLEYVSRNENAVRSESAAQLNSRNGRGRTRAANKQYQCAFLVVVGND